MINIVVITHGEFGAYLIEAAEGIVGVQNEGLKNISISQRTSLEKVRGAIEAAIAEMRSDDGLIFLIDMPGGTPMNVVLPLVKDIPESAVICGVNINMLTSAFAYRKNLDFDGLVGKILEDGRKAICEVKSLLLRGPAADKQ
jgi:mannose/fructose-specific phosphotransferase system component IIA